MIATIPAWIIALKSYGLYDRESDAIAHSTIDELAPLARVATVGGWLFLLLAWVTRRPAPVSQSIAFWLSLLVLLPVLRALARPLFRATRTYPQNTVIVGAGSVGQLIGRKLLTNREYHVNLLGFIDAMPKERRDDLRLLTILGRPEELEEIVADYNVERVIIAFSNESHEETMGLIRTLKDLDVRIDIVPRLFDIIPPRLTSHTIEGIPLITLPRLRLSTTSRFLKRTFDVLVSSVVVHRARTDLRPARTPDQARLEGPRVLPAAQIKADQDGEHAERDCDDARDEDDAKVRSGTAPSSRAEPRECDQRDAFNRMTGHGGGMMSKSRGREYADVEILECSDETIVFVRLVRTRMITRSLDTL